jgi:GH24 family phage-related lysozyme (muramidase)
MAVERNPFEVLPGGLDDSISDDGADLEIDIEIEDGDLAGIELSEDMAALALVEEDHYANLAEYLDDDDLKEIGSMVCEQFEADRDSRGEWESTFERGFDLLGLKLQETTEPFEGACTAVSPLIIESAIKFQSKASIELFPPGGPVRTQIVGSADPEKEAQATRVQQFMNYQLTDQISEYFDEFERMLFHLPLVGSAFKKIYYDPSIERPCSEFVPVDQFYVSYHAPDLKRADRYTHVIYRSPNELRKEISVGMYRDIDLPQASAPDPSMLGQKIDSLMGLAPSQDYDQQYVILEQHCYLDLPEPFNDPDGVAYPYIVTVEESSGQVLAIRRNFNKDDVRRERETYFAHYKFVPGFGFYGLGLIHLLGNLTMSATAALRSLVDAGQFANLPGGFKARGVRVVGGNDPISPGEFREVEATGMDLQKSIVPLPYKEPSQVLFQMLGFLTSAGQKFADTTDQIVADATNYGPVGTTMALLEAGAKFFSAVHKRLHHSQREEFNILSRLNFEFLPDVYPYQIPNIDSSIFKSDFDGRVDVIPVSDPNIPSAAHRLAMAQMVLQLASQAPPGMYDLRQVHLGILSASNIQNPERYMPAPMQPQPADPITDIQAASQGKPIKAFPEQDHASHIAVKSAFIQDPTLGQNPMMQSVVPVLQANIREHMVLQYAEQMGGLVNMGAEQLQQTNTEITPEIMGELTTAAAQQVLQANQGGANSVQTLEQQSMELERMSLDIKREGMQIEATKDAAELSLKNRELSIKQQEVQLRAASKISDKEDREVDRRIRALKDAGNMQMKRETSIRDQETKLAIEAVRAMLKEREMFMKEREARTQNLAQGGTVDDYSQGVREIDTLLGRLTLDTSEEAMATYEDAPINIPRADRYPAGDKIREIAEQTGIPLNAVIQEVRNQQQDNIVGEQAKEVLSELGASELLPLMMPETDDDEELRIAIRPSEELEDTKVSLGKTEIISSEDVERKMDKSSLDLVKEFEGFEEKAYDDSVGVRTIGYGTAATSGRAIPDEITEEEASALAQEDLDNLDRQLDDLLQVEVTPGQKEALKSLAYNVGIGAIARSQGLKKLNQGDIEGAAEEFFDEDKGFVKAGGEKLAGLVRRRAAERDVFFS